MFLKLTLLLVKLKDLKCTIGACSGSHGTRHLTIFSLFFAVLAVLLVHLLILVEGGGRACPGIANLTANVAEVASNTFGDGVPVNAIVSLIVTFRKIGQSVCDCRLHQIDDGRAKLKAQVKDCECPSTMHIML